MIVIFKKSLIYALVFLVLASSFLCFFSIKNAKNVGNFYALSIVIDAGHGGFDCGAIGINSKVYESDINLMIAKQLESELKKLSYKVILTRNTKGAVAETKNLDMRKRKEIIAEAKPDVVVSIHSNKWRNTSRRGAQVFFDDTNNGKNFAEHLQSIINIKCNQVYVGKTFSALAGDYFITKCYKCPSVILESGFLSNPQDDALLNDAKYRSLLVDCIVTALQA
ncbi:MAG: N-acetylmuramoyl-L-alanine amidase [Clostridia bacterium]